MYTPRALFSGLFFKICLFILSLYTAGLLVTLCFEKVSNLRHYRLEPRAKYGRCTVTRIMRCWDMAIWSIPKWPPAAILDLIQPQMAPLDLQSPKTPIEPNMKGIGWRVAELWPFEFFLQNMWMDPEVGRRSVGRRSSIFILLTLISYTPLLLQKERSARGVKMWYIKSPNTVTQSI